ncbi:MAG: hypothetical protein IK045_03495 [Bacteroidales bacterium]|nr:hypothetical protein [Bacteroidales bacterium]
MKRKILITDLSGALENEGFFSVAAPSGCPLGVSEIPSSGEGENAPFSSSPTPGNLPKVLLQITTPNESAKIEAEIVGLRELEGTRCYCDEAAEDEIVRRLAPFRCGGGRWREFPVHFIDTGEYHYVSKFFVDAIDVPFTLLVFDNHTDMQEPAFGEGLLSCGSWLADVMRSSKALQAVILAGPGGRIALYERHSSATFGADWAKGGDLPAVEKEEARAYDGAKGAVLQECGDFVLAATEELSVEGIKNICCKISIENLYISIDKDVMSVDCYRTEWSQGELGLEELESMVFAAVRNSFGGEATADAVENGFPAGSLLGIDICGGLDASKPALTCDLATNRRTDLALLDALVLIGAFA